jgi:hypothetical protein
MIFRKALSSALALIALTLALAACGGSDETTTVTTTAAAASGSEATGEEATTGTGEAAAEEIAPPDAKAQKQLDQIAEGLDEEQAQTDASGSDTVAGGSQGVPALSYTQAKGGLNRARYCGNYVAAGRNTSCAFALNVAYDYFTLGRARSFVSYSPVTGQAYQVYCRGRHPTICVAGNSATIYIG